MLNEIQTKALTLSINTQSLSNAMKDAKSDRVKDDPISRAKQIEKVTQAIKSTKPDMANVNAVKQSTLRPPKVPGSSVIESMGQSKGVDIQV